MFALKFAAVFAAIATTAFAQEDPNPDEGKSDCKIAKAGGIFAHQVVVRQKGDFQDICDSFTSNIHGECGDGISVTCPPDDDPDIKTFWYETDQSCGAAQVESAIRQTTGEEFPLCEQL